MRLEVDQNSQGMDLQQQRNVDSASAERNFPENFNVLIDLGLFPCSQGCRKVVLQCERDHIDCRNFGTCINEWVGYWCNCNMTSYVQDARGLCTRGKFLSQRENIISLF